MRLFNKHYYGFKRSMSFLLVLLLAALTGAGKAQAHEGGNERIRAEVQRLMKKGKIPGLSLVVIENGHSYINSFGYADPENKTKVDAGTRFEIGSCTKAFTALALLKLEKEQQVKLDDPVTNYLPWFTAEYKDSAASITVRQLLYHTSGIPQETIAAIPAGNEANALEQLVKKLSGLTLNNRPGTQFEYASVNYDIIGLIIEKITHGSFEDYITAQLLRPLGMFNTSVGYAKALPLNMVSMAQGHKIGYFKARPYDPPLFRANNPAGYVITDAHDLDRWLQFQLGMLRTGTILDSLVASSHARDETVAADRGSLSSYAAGWQVFLTGEGSIAHSGRNPNFSADIRFIPGKQLGVALMANSNSDFTNVAAEHVLKILQQEEVPKDPVISDYDETLSIVSIGLLVYILLAVAYLIFRAYAIAKGNARSVRFTGRKLLGMIATLVVMGVFLGGAYLLPEALAKFSWQAALVWAPVSLVYMVYALVAAFIISYVAYVINITFPDVNKYINVAPKMLVLSLISGIGNAAVIILITTSVNKIDTHVSAREFSITIFYFLLAFFAYLYGRKVVQSQLIRLAVELIYDIRNELLTRIFSSSYQDFEKMNSGRIYTTLNNDTDRIGYAANTAVSISTNLITTLVIFSYLMMISFKAALATAIVIVCISFIYHKVGKTSNVLFESVRDSFNKYLDLLNGMVDGFKELSIHRFTRISYKKDIEDVNEEFRDKLIAAQEGYIKAFLAGESMLILTLASVVFILPLVFPSLTAGVVLSYIVVMLYLIGPINTILGSIPDVMRIKIAWKRVQRFKKELPPTHQLNESLLHAGPGMAQVDRLQVKGLKYKYTPVADEKGFEVGPVDFELRSGETLFVTGSNGSGKSTLIKLLTGLYHHAEGKIVINGKIMTPAELGEYYSVVFNPFHLFKKLYAFEIAKDTENMEAYLSVLGLTEKVNIQNGSYSTTSLSQGQRKRLTLFQCFLEDRPIYLFDEWASDQDPDYRRFFYKELIPEMKRKGKLVIVITHDEHYFNDADLVIRLNYGKQEEILVKERLVQ